MKYEKIPGTSIEISKIGFGTRTLDLNSYNKGKTIVNAAFDAGINFFVTSSNYQSGKIEQRLGKILTDLEIRDQVVISTSGGVTHNNGKYVIDSSPSALKRSIEASLKHLGTDYIDHYEIHTYDPMTPIGDTISFLLEYIEAGTIKSIGTSSFQPEIVKQWSKYLIPILVQLPLNPMQRRAYHLSWPMYNDTKLNIGLVPYTPFFFGLLGQFLKEMPKSLLEGINTPDTWLQSFMNLSRDFKKLSNELDLSFSELVLKWVLSHKGITSLLIGTNNVDHLIQNVNASESTFSRSILKSLEKMVNSHTTDFQLKNNGNRPVFEQQIKSVQTNSDGKLVAICDSGLKFIIPNSYPTGSIISLDIETAEVVSVVSPD